MNGWWGAGVDIGIIDNRQRPLSNGFGRDPYEDPKGFAAISGDPELGGATLDTGAVEDCLLTLTLTPDEVATSVIVTAPVSCRPIDDALSGGSSNWPPCTDDTAHCGSRGCYGVRVGV